MKDTIPARWKRPPWVHARILKATSALSPAWKLIWLEHYGLANGGQGATMGAAGVARRVGMARVTVERARVDLVRMGLMPKRDRGAGRTAEWFPQIPPGCRPQGRRLTDDEVERYAELLTRLIAPAPASMSEHDEPELEEVTHPMRELSPEKEF